MATLANVSSVTFRTFVLLVVAVTTLGCTILRPVVGSDFATVSSQISAGDKIEVTRQDHSTVMFKADDISESGVGGEGIFVEYGDIRQIRVVRKSPGRTTFSIIGGVAVVLLLALIIEGPAFYPGPP